MEFTMSRESQSNQQEANAFSLKAIWHSTKQWFGMRWLAVQTWWSHFWSKDKPQQTSAKETQGPAEKDFLPSDILYAEIFSKLDYKSIEHFALTSKKNKQMVQNYKKSLETSLHWAVYLYDNSSSKFEVIKQLITAGLDINALDRNGESPLSLAISMGKFKLVQDIQNFCGEKVEFDLDRPYGSYPTGWHLLAEKANKQLLISLVKNKKFPKGADLKTNEEGEGFLHYLARNEDGEAIAAMDLIFLDSLDSNGFLDMISGQNPNGPNFGNDLNTISKAIQNSDRFQKPRNNKGASPLHIAAQLGNSALLRQPGILPYVLEYLEKFLLGHLDKDKKTLFHYFALAKKNQSNLRQFIIEKILKRFTPYENKRFIMDPDSDGKTPIHYAVISGDLELLKCFFEHVPPDCHYFLTKLIDKNNFTPIDYANKRESDKIKEFLLSKADLRSYSKSVWFQYSNGKTLLHLAVFENNVDLVKNYLNLVEKPSEVISAYDLEGKTPFHNAVSSGNIAMVQIFLEKFNDTNLIFAHDLQGDTPLHHAVMSGNVELVKILLNQINEPERTRKIHDLFYAKDKKGKIALHYAAEKSSVEMFRALLEFIDKKNFNYMFLKDENDKTILHLLSENTNSNIESITKFLVEEKLTILDTEQTETQHRTKRRLLCNNDFDKSGQSPIQLIAKKKDLNLLCLFSTFYFLPSFNFEGQNLENDFEYRMVIFILGLVFKDKSDNLERNFTKKDILEAFAPLLHAQIITFMLSKKKFKVNNEQNLLIHMAIQNDRYDDLKYLLSLLPMKQRKLLLNLKDASGNTILHTVILKIDTEPKKVEEFIDFALKNGFNADELDHLGLPLSYYAALKNKPELVKKLIDREKNRDLNSCNALKAAIKQANDAERTCQYLIENGAHIHVKDEDSKTPLHFAAEKGLVNIAQLLIKNKAKVNWKGKFKITPLYLAAGAGNLSIVKELINAGADINIQSEIGRTPLDSALGKEKNLEVIRYLVEWGGCSKNPKQGGVNNYEKVEQNEILNYCCPIQAFSNKNLVLKSAYTEAISSIETLKQKVQIIETLKQKIQKEYTFLTIKVYNILLQQPVSSRMNKVAFMGTSNHVKLANEFLTFMQQQRWYKDLNPQYKDFISTYCNSSQQKSIENDDDLFTKLSNIEEKNNKPHGVLLA